MKLFAVLLLASLATLSFTSQQNELISGNFELTVEDESRLFEQYLYQHSSELLHNFQMSEISVEERKSVFLENLQKIIVHNKNPSKSFSKGF
jgi:hypothetical protein